MGDDNIIANASKLIIQGITSEGKVFRPSDWPERLCGRLATFRNQRVIYSAYLRPGVKEGQKCVIVDVQLETINPELYQYLLDFAKTNDLKIYNE